MDQPIAPFQFSLASILLLTTLIAAICGMFSIAPLIAITFSVFALPSVVRTAYVTRRSRATGASLEFIDKPLTFIFTLFFCVLLVVAVLIAFGLSSAAFAWVWSEALGFRVTEDFLLAIVAVASLLALGVGAGLIFSTLNAQCARWTAWLGLLLAGCAAVGHWINYCFVGEAFFIVAAVAMLGFVFSAVAASAYGHGIAACGAGLSTGPLLVMLFAVLVQDWEWFESPISLISVTIASLLLALAMPVWVKQLGWAKE